MKVLLSDMLKDLRRRNYLNQTAFAKRIGVSQGAVSQWENNLTRPNLDQLKAISDEFNISIDDLLSGDPEPVTPTGPRTREARIVSAGMDKMPPEKREQAIKVLQAIFAEYFGGEKE